MVSGGEQNAGGAPRGRTFSSRRGSQPERRQARSLAAGRKSSGVSGLAGLALLILWGAWSLGAVGCTASGSGYNSSVLANMRQSPEEISRLERNAHYYKLMGQPELGLKEVELAHRQNPDNLQITNFLARNYEELGQFEAARQLYQEALTRHGPHAILANNLCFSYYQEGRWQEAETCFRQTLARDPGNAAARNNLGLLYCRLGRQDEARRLWQEAEGAAAADAMIGRALAALGTPDRTYAASLEAAPPAAQASQTPKPPAAAPRVPAPIPAKPGTPDEPAAPRVAAKPLAPKPAPAAVTQEPLAAAAPAAVPQAATPPQAPLTAVELAGPAIEIRNGTRTRKLALRTRSRLRQEGFTVAKIGNHVNFGAATTIIYYRPEAERIALALGRMVFPPATLSANRDLKKGMDIKVLLGHDLLENPQFLAFLSGAGPPAVAAAAAKSGGDQPPASHQELQEKRRAAATPEPPSVAPQPKEVTAPTLPVPAPKPLTAAERLDTAIEVRNGTRTRNLAHQTRLLLRQEGFTVAKIGNHVDFGAAKTIIYYRPEAENVARTMGRTVFPQAELTPSSNLKKGMDIRILLGADLLQRPQLITRLMAGDK